MPDQAFLQDGLNVTVQPCLDQHTPVYLRQFPRPMALVMGPPHLISLIEKGGFLLGKGPELLLNLVSMVLLIQREIRLLSHRIIRSG